jgi:hypothetical protein
MSLSNLTSLTQAQYRALQITPFQTQPSRTTTGNPDSNVGVQLGGWVGTDVLAFTVSDAANNDSSLVIDAINPGTLDLNVTADSDPSMEMTYWTVNMGPGASGTNWQISFIVENNNTNTGSWKFVKGKGVDPEIKY